MSITKRDVTSIVELVVMLLYFCMLTWSLTFGFIGTLCFIVIFFGIIFIISFKIENKYELSTVIVVPILLSAFQNVYMGFFAPQLSSMSIQVLTVLNFFIACIILVVLMLRKRSMIERDKIYHAFILLVAYSFVSVIFLNKINVISIISSLRNVISVYLFLFIGILASDNLNIGRFQKIVLLIAFCVVVVGFFDVASKGAMWNSLNITDLWTKKGIRVQASGLPTNFYSSETINGERIRRMASTFADPVNLGAFLFAAFAVAWYRNNKIIGILTFVAILLTVSKGAMLGILILMCVYAYYCLKRSVFMMIAGFAAFCGIGFLAYAFKTSADSVFLHISGLVAAFRSLLTHPLGSGIGSAGVLARQFSRYSSNMEITETGLGMIIGQLGIVGLILYLILFKNVIKLGTLVEDKREKTFCLTLSLSIIANILFNEVALSPNSCAIYFVMIGYSIGKIKNMEKTITEDTVSYER
jgi:hypothetical protein